MERLEAFVFGRVQTVMYRDFAQRKARGLGLTGHVKNLPNRSVQVVAEGPRAVLEQYVLKLGRGPLLARVERVDVAYSNATGEYTSFLISYD